MYIQLWTVVYILLVAFFMPKQQLVTYRIDSDHILEKPVLCSMLVFLSLQWCKFQLPDPMYKAE